MDFHISIKTKCLSITSFETFHGNKQFNGVIFIQNLNSKFQINLPELSISENDIRTYEGEQEWKGGLKLQPIYQL